MNRFNLSAWAIAHRSIVYFLMLAIVVVGIASYLRLGRNEDPTFTIKTMVVQAQWPGATLEDTLLQVTERIERKLQETPHLDYLKSYTKAGQSTVFVYLKGSTGPTAVSDTWYQVRKKVHDIEPTLPLGVPPPVCDDEFGDTYGIVYGFTADGFTHRELRDYVEDIRSRLLQVPDVAKVNLIGAQPERIYIQFSPAKLAGYGLTPTALTAALQAQNIVVPSGVITTEAEAIKLRVSGALRSEKDVLAVNFAVGERIIRLADIAQVQREDADPPDPIFRINGKPGLGLSISMRDGGDVLALGRNIEQTMQELRADLPIGIEPIMVADQPETVSKSISEFMEALWESIAIVLAVSVVSLGLRAGAIVIVSIPLVLAVVFGAMGALGIDLQRISLGALIISLGLLVDDAMITIESMVFRLERGDNKQQAAVFAYASTAYPRLTGTLVTIAGFLPVGLARSDAGEYTFSLFAVVALALLASWVVSGLFAPVVGLALLRPPKHPHGETLGAPMRLFRRCLVAAMRAKWITIAVTVALFAAALAGTRLVPEQFFPASDRPELLVDLKLQDNASILATRDVAEGVDQLLAADPDIERFSTYVGQGAIRFYLPIDVALPNDFFAQSVVVTKGLKQREQVRARLEQALAARFPEVVARIYPLELGPPVGWPVKYRVSGPDPQGVRAIALQVADLLGATAGVRNVNFDWVEPARVMRIRIDQDQARQLGLSSQDVALALNGVVTGTTVTQVRDSIYLIDVVARAEQAQRNSLELLRSLQIPLSNGRVVPLRQIATFEYDQEYPIIWRRDRVPDPDGAGRCGAGRAAGDGGSGRAASHRQARGDPAERLSDRDRRLGGGKRQGEGFSAGRRSCNGAGGAHHSDLPVAELPARAAGAERGAARAHRRGGGLAAGAGSSRLCRDPRRTGAGRHDRAKFGHPDRPDRARKGGGHASMGRGGHRRDPPHPSDPAHRVGRHTRDDSDRADRLLGPHGVRHHRWAGGGDSADPDLPARPVCRLVQDRRTCSRHRPSRAVRGSGTCLRGEYGVTYIRIRKGNVMTQASEDLSVAKLFAEREERRRRDQEAAERFQRRKKKSWPHTSSGSRTST